MFTSALRPKPPERVSTRRALPLSTSSMRDLLHLAQLAVEVRDARAFRRGDEDLHHAAVFLRRELARQTQALRTACPAMQQHHAAPNSAERATDDPQRLAARPSRAQARGVTLVEVVEEAIDAAGHARLRHAVRERVSRPSSA